MSLLGDAALAYAARGYKVFPCVPAGKRPVTRNGLYDATTDAGLVAAWWDDSPAANIAIAVTSWFMVVDLDAPHTLGLPDGVANFAGLWRGHAAEPLRTATARTPRGGRHLWFRVPPAAVDVSNSAGRVAPGVDVRGVGGYVVVPPSRTREGAYEWIDLPGIQVAPDWLLELVAKRQPPPRPIVEPRHLEPGSRGTRYGLAVLRGVTDRVRFAQEGNRNACLYWASCRCGEYTAGGELATEVAEDALIAAALEAGLPLEEATATVVSGMFRGAQTPRRAA
jgi:hypothetical protein